MLVARTIIGTPHVALSGIGCGFYAGSSGAIAVTGIGEEIIKRMLARRVYDCVFSGMGIKEATQEGIGAFPPEIPVGIIALSKSGYSVASNRSMAHAVLVSET